MESIANSSKLTTIFEADVHGTDTCVKLMKKQRLPRKTIKIHINAQAAWNVLESKTVWNCRKTINRHKKEMNKPIL